MTEIWKPVEGYEGFYSVSSEGKVLSHARKDRRGKSWPDRYLSMRPIHGAGYPRVVLHVDMKRNAIHIHRLVATHFIENPESLPMVNHKDGDKGNCRVENLEWVTGLQNHQHAAATGLKAVGVKHGLAKLDEYLVRLIRSDPRGIKAMAEVIGVSPSAIGAVRRNQTWRHVV